MIKAVIFDLDGVIVDTAKYHYIAWKQLANDLGFDISLAQNEQLKGVSRVKSLDLILGWGQVQLSQDKKNDLLIEKNEVYLDYIKSLTKADILPGIETILKFLKASKIAIALGSASKNAVPILERLDLMNYFNAIVDGNVVQHAKPDPEVFLKAAEKLNIEPKKCLVIEDSSAGLEAAKNAQMISIGIGDKTVLNQADLVVNNTALLTVDVLKTVLKI